MFVVHNDLGDDWVWVTSLLTDDSGIINQKLVQSIVRSSTCYSFAIIIEIIIIIILLLLLILLFLY